MEDGRTIEVGVIGREGLVGINVFLGGIATPDKAIVQLPGGALRMETKDLRKEVRFGSPLQRLLLDYTRSFLAVISQSVACSQHHGIDRRLARWLLTRHDYAGPGGFRMVHESIAAMLGVRRVGITEAAQRLQADGLISYRRGRICVLDKAGLEKRSCECYGYIRQQYQRLHQDLPRLLSRK
jgi:CRP-like cAMP-binding protein